MSGDFSKQISSDSYRNQRSANQRWFFARLFEPVDNSALILFRIMFGILLLSEIVYSLLTGSAYNMYVKPGYTITFIGFEFLQHLRGGGMYLYLAAMMVLAAMITIGAFYRFAIVTFTVMWAGIFFLYKAHYHHPTYIILLACILMIFMPANRSYSVDARRNQAIQTQYCPQWIVWIFVVQIVIIYFFAAVYKIYPDWISGKYIGLILSLRKSALYGNIIHQHWFHLLFSYTIILFDLLITPLFLYRKTRSAALVLSIIFNLFNSAVFSLGIFPYLCLALNVFFFDGETISKVFFKRSNLDGQIANHQFKYSQPLVWFLAVYFLVQIYMPLRFLLFPGNVNWTEEGERMSWRIMMRWKKGEVKYKVIDPLSQKSWEIDPKETIGRNQAKILAISPDMIWQYAQVLKKEFADSGYNNVSIHAIGWASLNDHPRQQLVDSTVDLTKVQWHPFKHSDWIVPYKKE